MDFFGWLGAMRRHSGLWQRRATTPDGKRHDLIGTFILGYRLTPLGNITAYTMRVCPVWIAYFQGGGRVDESDTGGFS